MLKAFLSTFKAEETCTQERYPKPLVRLERIDPKDQRVHEIIVTPADVEDLITMLQKLRTRSMF